MSLYIDGIGSVERMGATDPDQPPPGLTPAELSDWARSRASARAGSAAAAAAEAAGKEQQRAQAAQEVISSYRAALPASVPTYRPGLSNAQMLLIIGGIGLGAYLIFRRPARRSDDRRAK